MSELKFSWKCPRCSQVVGLKEDEIQWEYIPQAAYTRTPSQANQQVLSVLIALHLSRHMEDAK